MGITTSEGCQKKAILRYLEDGRKIPMEWVNEFNELLNKPVK